MSTLPEQTPDPRSELEDLVAEAMALLDQGDEAALAEFLDRHPAHKSRIREVIDKFAATGILGRDAHRVQLPERMGEFRLIRQIGSGGMGMVFEAEQQSLNRRVALKVIRPELLFFDGARERFRREVEATGRLQHPCIVPILACGEHDNVPFFAMELLPGSSADAVTRRLRGRPFADLRGSDLATLLEAPTDAGVFAGDWWQTCVGLIRQAAEAMAHAHERGIVHRDLKPSNVMLTPDGRAVVLDFGLAHVGNDERITKTGGEPGSPAYMSPEQVRGEASDERADVYSLAATLYQLLALRAPFPLDDRHRLRQRILDGDCPPVTAINPTVPRDLGIVLQVAMDVDRQRRYASMTAFAADLAAVAEHRTIAAHRTPPLLRLLRWSHRHRVAAAALAAGACTALLLPLFAWHAGRDALVQQRQEQAFAERQLEAALDAIDGLGAQTEQLRAAGPDAATMATALQHRALAFWQQLRQEAPDMPRVQERLRLARSGVIDGLLLAGNLATATTVAAEAVDEAPTARALADRARVDLAAGRVAAAVTGFRAALRRADDPGSEAVPPADRSQWLHGLADAAAGNGDLAGALAAADADLALLQTDAATLSDLPLRRARALAHRAVLATAAGDRATAGHHLHQAAELLATAATDRAGAAGEVLAERIRVEQLLQALPAADAAARGAAWRQELHLLCTARPTDPVVHAALAALLVDDAATARAAGQATRALATATTAVRLLLRVEGHAAVAGERAQALATSLTGLADDLIAVDQVELAIEAARLLALLPGPAEIAQRAAATFVACAAADPDQRAALHRAAAECLHAALARGLPLTVESLRQDHAALADTPAFPLLLELAATAEARR